jgi:heme-degrading monooxygenase HmoA
MYVVVRQYEGASPLADAMAERADDVKELLTGVEGFVAYHAARDGDTVTTVSVCRDRAGAEETTRRAAAWVQENLPGTTVSPPRVGTGEAFLSF